MLQLLIRVNLPEDRFSLGVRAWIESLGAVGRLETREPFKFLRPCTSVPSVSRATSRTGFSLRDSPCLWWRSTNRGIFCAHWVDKETEY